MTSHEGGIKSWSCILKVVLPIFSHIDNFFFHLKKFCAQLKWPGHSWSTQCLPSVSLQCEQKKMFRYTLEKCQPTRACVACRTNKTCMPAFLFFTPCFHIIPIHQSKKPRQHYQYACDSFKPSARHFDTQPDFSNIIFLFHGLLTVLQLTIVSNFTKQSMLFLN